MKTYDELYDDMKRAVDEYFEEAYDGDYHLGAYNAYRYVLDRLEEIREDNHSKVYVQQETGDGIVFKF